jgi:TPR repeat protein
VRKDTKRALVMFDRACSSGIGRGCDALADRLEAGAGGDTGRYRQHIAALHRTACNGDDRSGCAHSGEQRLANHDRDAAYGDFWKACELGDAKSCYQAGMLANKPNGARLLFLRACDAHHAKGCGQLADMFASGRGGERNWRQAIKYAEKACSLEGASPCTRALALKQQSPDWHCANEKACERLCDEGIARSCRRLAELRDNEPDAYERGCIARDGESCTRRGHAATTLDVGAKWYARGCAAGDPSACAYRDFVDADDGSQQALDLLRKRCKSDRDACVLLGLAVVDSRTEEAQRLWKNACDRKHGIACRLLAEEFGGRSSKPLMKRACSAGDGVACEQLSLLAPPRRPTAPAWL